MKTVKIGQFEEVPAMGYGAMVLEGYYGQANEDDSKTTICTALNAGIQLIDTADTYGAGHNERLVASALEGVDKPYLIATKMGMVYDNEHDGSVITSGWGHQMKVNTSPGYIKWAVDQSLLRLGCTTIDLLYVHYFDPKTPVKDTMTTLKELVADGKIKEIGLSNMTADELKQAHAVHPVAAVQYEYSVQNRKAEDEILPLTKELGITFVAWAPLGAGLLTGGLDKLDANDFRNMRFPEGVSYVDFKHKLEDFYNIAHGLNITPAQLALAWLYHKGNNIMTIPGTRKANRISENLQSLNVRLTDEQVKQIDDLSANNGLGLKRAV